MPRRRIGKSAKCPTYPIQLRQAISRFLPCRGLPTLPGNGKLRWTARLLAVCAVLTAWGAEPTLGDRFGAARDVLVGMFPTRRRPGGTYAGFIAALARGPPRRCWRWSCRTCAAACAGSPPTRRRGRCRGGRCSASTAARSTCR